MEDRSTTEPSHERLAVPDADVPPAGAAPVGATPEKKRKEYKQLHMPSHEQACP